ncbi:MAG TPA: hypothetical protein VEL47_01185 [Myxococcota bacterium]|nr:hypothetical protein [Myxococcota bacterium]
MKSAGKKLGFFGWILFITLSPGLFATNYVISWDEAKKPAKDFYQVSELKELDDALLKSQVEEKISHLGARLPDFDKKTNQHKQPVKTLLSDSCLHGLKLLGAPTTVANRDVKSMMFSILEKLHSAANAKEADRLFRKLVHGFTDCETISHRVIVDVFQELMGQSSMRVRAARILDQLKQKWLMQTINQLEKLTQNSLDHDLETAYLQKIGKDFGIVGFLQAALDKLSTKKVSYRGASAVFHSFASARELIDEVLGDLLSESDDARKAEIFRWVSDRGYFAKDLFNDSGQPKREVAEKILLDFGIIAPRLPDSIKKLMDSQEVLFDSFLPTTGYSSWEELRAAVRKAEPLLDIVQAFDQNQVELVVFAPDSHRDAILSRGILNQYQTGSSKGTFNTPARFSVERSYLNQTAAEYGSLPIEWRPKYGKIVSKSALSQSTPASFYGQDLYLLKLEALKNRVTWTPGDSLNRLNKKANDAGVCLTRGDVHEPKNWDDLFLPWSKVDLLIPFLGTHEFAKSASTLPSGQLKPHASMTNLKPILGSRAEREEYPEFQVFGEIAPSDVQSFIFSNTPPTANNLAIFAMHKIGVFNGQKIPPEKYQTSYFVWGGDGKCKKRRFDFDHFLDEEADIKYCELLERAVYDKQSNEWGKVLKFTKDGTHAQVKYIYIDVSPVTREIPLKDLFKRVDKTQKNTPLGQISFSTGSHIYNAERKWYGLVEQVFEGGYLIIRYTTNDNRTKYLADQLENIHKLFDGDSVDHHGQRYKLAQLVYDEAAEKLGVIQSFYTAPLALVKFANYASSAPFAEYRYLSLDRLHPEVEKIGKKTNAGVIEYQKGDKIYNPTRKWWGIILAVFGRDYVNVRYPMGDDSDKYTMEKLHKIHKKLDTQQANIEGFLLSIDQNVALTWTGDQGSIVAFYDNGLIKVKFPENVYAPRYRYERLEDLRLIGDNKKAEHQPQKPSFSLTKWFHSFIKTEQ